MYNDNDDLPFDDDTTPVQAAVPAGACKHGVPLSADGCIDCYWEQEDSVDWAAAERRAEAAYYDEEAQRDLDLHMADPDWQQVREAAQRGRQAAAALAERTARVCKSCLKG